MRSLTVELRYRLEIDLCYWIDNAQEQHRIAPDTAVYARYFCPDLARTTDRTPERMDQPCSCDEWLDSLDQGAAQVEREYLDWLNAVTTPKEHKLACLCVGVSQMHDFVRDAATYVADHTVYEHNPYRMVEKPDAAKLKFTINEYKPEYTGGNHTISIFNIQPFKDQSKFVKNTIMHARGLHKRYSKHGDASLTEMRVRYSGRPSIVRGFADPKARKSVRRGIDVLTELLGYEAVRRFVTGKQPLVIDGKVFSFRLKLARASGLFSHGSMKTEVWLGDQRVCNLCIYTPQTPPLDHLVHFIAQVQLGFEDELIEIGNPFDVAVTEPTGVDVLDRRLAHHFGHSPRRIPVRRIPPVLIDLSDDDDGIEVIDVDSDRPHIMVPDMVRIRREIRLGNSNLADTIVAKRSKRVLRDLYRDDLAGISFPDPRIIEV